MSASAIPPPQMKREEIEKMADLLVLQTRVSELDLAIKQFKHLAECDCSAPEVKPGFALAVQFLQVRSTALKLKAALGGALS